MSIITIILFFVYLFGLGYTVSSFFKKQESLLENLFISISLGLGVLPILLIFLNFLNFSLLDWKILFVLSLIYPLYKLFKNYKSISLPSFTKSDVYMIIVILISLVSLWIYTTGAFAYPYLEDEDPWGHAVGIKYVSLEKSGYDPSNVEGIDEVLSYMDPYPPAYDIFLGILHQTSPDITWTMKFFNALIISLGFIFFYLFVKLFTASRNIALLSTFFLASLPSYLSHFIWAHSLVITVFFPTLYAFLKIKENKNWWIVAAICFASIWVSQNLSQPIKISTMMFLFVFVGSMAASRVMKYEILALIVGGMLSWLWWGVMILKYSFTGFLRIYGGSRTSSIVGEGAIQPSIFTKLQGIIGALVSSGGTGSRAYNLNDFLIAKETNMINNPIGIGLILSILVLVAIVYILWKYRTSIVEDNNSWLLITLFWLVFTFMGVNGQTFPISVARGPFRVWMLMAIPIAILTGFFFVKLWNMKPSLKHWGIIFILWLFAFFYGRGSFDYSGVYFTFTLLIIIGGGLMYYTTKNENVSYYRFFLILILLGVLLTSGMQKMAVNTAIWPTSGSYTSGKEPFDYAAWFDTIPDDTGVFLMSPRDKLTIGYGKFSCDWCANVLDFREDILHKNVDQIHSFLKNNNYEYFLINPAMDTKYFNKLFGENETKVILPQFYNDMTTTRKFMLVHQVPNSFFVFRVN